MFNLGMGEITVILLLALIFLGPSKLPDLASGLGRIIREIRKATSDVKNEIALDDTFRKPFEELRDAVTLHPDELKRRDQLKQSLEEARKRAEAEQQAAAAAPDTAASAGASAAEPAAGEPTPPPALVVPEAPPRGTVARREAAPPAAPPPAPPTHLGPPRVTPPISSVAADRANVTQVLSEADILTSAARPPGLPPPPPSPAHLPPPLPGTGSGPAPAKKT